MISQISFAEYVKGINDKQNKIKKELSELTDRRIELMDKYFD